MKLIEKLIPHELGGDAGVDFSDAGLIATLSIPSCHVVSSTVTKAQAAIAGSVGKDKMPVLSGTHLLVEDDFLISLAAEEILLSLGANEVITFGNVNDAINYLNNHVPDFALLDINLGSETSWPVAARLDELGVPYAFATGYGAEIDYPLALSGVPVATKPYTPSSVRQALLKSLVRIPI